MTWTIAGDSQLARYFEQENIWTKSWEPIIGERATVTDYMGRQLSLPIWECTFNGHRKRFAADEVSNSVWVFALQEKNG